jgi:hypothetical protein
MIDDSFMEYYYMFFIIVSYACMDAGQMITVHEVIVKSCHEIDLTCMDMTDDARIEVGDERRVTESYLPYRYIL